jgi:hypothetical protein
MSASIMRVKMQQGAHTGMQFTLEAATLLSDENAWRVIYTGPLLEARVPNIPPTTAFKMRLTIPVSRLLCCRVPLLLFMRRGCLQVPTDFGSSSPSDLSFFTTPRCRLSLRAACHLMSLQRSRVSAALTCTSLTMLMCSSPFIACKRLDSHLGRGRCLTSPSLALNLRPLCYLAVLAQDMHRMLFASVTYEM